MEQLETVETNKITSLANAAINSLDDITKAGGAWMAKKYPQGGGVKYTESTDYNKQSSLNAYHQYQTNIVSSELFYDPLAPSPKPGMVSSTKTNFSNRSSVSQSVTYNQSETTTQSFNWSVTESLKLGVKSSVKAGVPLVAEVTTELSVNIDTSSTQGATSTKTQTWSVSQPIICPANSQVTARLNVSTATYDIPWTAETILEGYVAIWFNKRFIMDGHVGDHQLYFYPIGSVIKDCIANNIIGTNGYTKLDSYTIIASSRGLFFGGQGTEMTVTIEETPLKSDHTIDEEIIRNEYQIHLDNTGKALLLAGE